MNPHEYTIMESVEDAHWWFVAKRTFVGALLPKPSGSLRILDVGCGTGAMTTLLNAWGIVTRIEQSPIAQNYLRKKQIPFIPCSIMDLPMRKSAYDMVCFFDVLYHRSIKNDVQVLRLSNSRLKKNGLLCVTDCANPRLWSNHDVHMHARQRYTKHELEQKIVSAGFTVIRSSYIYCFTYPLFIAQRLLSKYVSFETVNIPPRPINRLLLSLCRLEAKIVPYIQFPFGSSLILLAKKT